MATISAIPALPDGIRLGSSVLVTLSGSDRAHETRLSATDSNGAWFLSAPPELDIASATRVNLYARRADGEHLSFEARIAGIRHRPCLPSLLVLEAPVPAEIGLPPEKPAWEDSTIAIEPIRVVARQSGPGRPRVGEVVRLSGDEAVLRLKHRPKGDFLSLSIDPPEEFLRSKARSLERTRPGTSHTFWRLQRVYAVYFAGIEAFTVSEPIEADGGYLVHVQFESAHSGCDELVRFLELEAEMEQIREAEAMSWALEGLSA